MGKSVPSRVDGPLRPFASGFWVQLRERGYEWTAVHARMRLMAELSAWMAARGVESRRLTRALIAEFLEAARVSHRGKQWCSPTSERQLLDYLRCVGLVLEAGRRRLPTRSSCWSASSSSIWCASVVCRRTRTRSTNTGGPRVCFWPAVLIETAAGLNASRRAM